MRSRLAAPALFVLLLVGCSDTAADDDDAGLLETGVDASLDSISDVGGSDAEPDVDSEPDLAVEPDAAVEDADDDTAPVVISCDDDDECDDGLSCTNDSCERVSGFGRICQWRLERGNCLINNVCHDDRAANPRDPCELCEAVRPFEWSFIDDGNECDDGDACTSDTICLSGTCVGGPTRCDDGSVCTIDTCSPSVGCVFTGVADSLHVPCDDGLVCTANDTCRSGFCTGEQRICDDGDACTDDACEEGTGCVTVDNSGACDDGDPCTVNTTCSAGECGGGNEELCDDFNQCTIDLCDPDAGCVHIPTFNPCCIGAVSVCDDADPCTTDLCDPDTALCAYELNTAPCDDGNACTEGDICSEGECTAGDDVDCDDGETCTDDACNPGVGCINNPSVGSGEDGVACTVGDFCSDGDCLPGDSSACVCEPSFDDDAGKVSAMSLGSDTSEGESLDVDGDGRRDNSLGPLGGFINEPLADAVTGGDLMLVIEFDGFSVGDFTVALYAGELADSNPDCDYQTETCDYLAERDALDPDTCVSLISLPANYNGTVINAGGPTTNIPLQLPLSSDSTLDLTLFGARLELFPEVSGGEVVSFTGILAGAVPASDLEAAILALDPDSLPLAPDALLGLLDTLAPNDIDTDGDEVPDAKSIALKLTGIDARLLGATEP